jgi:acyl-CoA synthetase (AMP-forming)/AMP-acid ligase II
MADRSLTRLVQERASQQPDGTFIDYEVAVGLTWAQLHRRAQVLRHARLTRNLLGGSTVLLRHTSHFAKNRPDLDDVQYGFVTLSD